MKNKITIKKTDALIVVDVQNDFLSGGSLPVPKGEKIIPFLNYYLDLFKKAQGKVFATRDWHPINHLSFKEQGGIWPSHCICGTKEAEFTPKLKLPKNVTVISKATDPDKESYSGFDGTELCKKLKKNKVINVFVAGLAIDYCVKNTVIDAINLGFKTFFLKDASQGIDVNPGDVKRSIEMMQNKGAIKVKKQNFF
ncbi:MAG: nicotinamidase [Candidatus Lokiarchaeota archaeon]|nr:nicotinamidase [Candidatus Bathyarchaeota archaeon]MBY9012789.1 nicotinamidase [Candidatus Lokiarchaeota archaeon]